MKPYKATEYVSKSELLRGLDDSQLEVLMENLTVFSHMDFCPSPCNICAYEIQKTPGQIMDIELIEFFFQNFSNASREDQPMEYALDPLAYVGRNGETFIDILDLHKKHFDYYPQALTALPTQSEDVILDMIFNYDFSRCEEDTTQAVVPNISRHLANATKVDSFVEQIKRHPRFVCDRASAENARDYVFSTDFGERIMTVSEVTPIPVGRGSQYKDETSSGVSVFRFYQRKGVAVLPSGFYNHDPANPDFGSLMKNRITPENFDVVPKEDLFSAFFYNHANNEGKLVLVNGR